MDSCTPKHNHLLADFPTFWSWARRIGYKPNKEQLRVHRRILDRVRIGDGDRGTGKSTAIAAEVAFAMTEFRLLPPLSETLVVCGTVGRCNHMSHLVRDFLDRAGVEYEVVTRDRISIVNGGTVDFCPLDKLERGGSMGMARKDFICFDEIIEDPDAVRAIAPLAAKRLLSLSS